MTQISTKMPSRSNGPSGPPFALESVNVLAPKVVRYITSLAPHPVHFLTADTSWRLPTAPGDVNLIILGDGVLFPFLKNAFNPRTQIKIWVLCTKLKRLLVEFLGIPSEAIAVIDRYSIFPLGRNAGHSSDFEQIIHAGRWDEQKNTDLLVKVLAATQDSPGLRHRKIAFFEADRKSHLRDLVDSLSWRKRPTIVSNRGRNWSSDIAPSLLCNFSTYRYEDFSVVCAQSQMRNFQMIVADWYGLSDLKRFSGRKISSRLLWKAKDNKAAFRKLCSQFVDGIENPIKFESYPKPSRDAQPVSISTRDLAKITAGLTDEKRSLLKAFFESGGFPQRHDYFQPITEILGS